MRFPLFLSLFFSMNNVFVGDLSSPNMKGNMVEVVALENDAFIGDSPRFAYARTSYKYSYLISTADEGLKRFWVDEEIDISGRENFPFAFFNGMNGPERAALRALQVCHSKYGLDYGVKQYSLGKMDGSSDFVIHSKDFCSPPKPVGVRDIVVEGGLVETVKEAYTNNRYHPFAEFNVQDYYVFKTLQCSKSSPATDLEMMVTSDQMETCRKSVIDHAKVSVSTGSSFKNRRPNYKNRLDNEKGQAGIETSLETSSKAVYIRCRALSPGGRPIIGDLYPIGRSSIQRAKEQARRNFMVTRCGGPLGGRCAMPVKCESLDSRQRPVD